MHVANFNSRPVDERSRRHHRFPCPLMRQYPTLLFLLPPSLVGSSSGTTPSECESALGVLMACSQPPPSSSPHFSTGFTRHQTGSASLHEAATPPISDSSLTCSLTTTRSIHGPPLLLLRTLMAIVLDLLPLKKTRPLSRPARLKLPFFKNRRSDSSSFTVRGTSFVDPSFASKLYITRILTEGAVTARQQTQIHQ